MFTGIVTDIGEIVLVEPRPQGVLHRFVIGCAYDPASIAKGASIACCGVCLTVVAAGVTGGRSSFTVEAAAETLAKTTAGRWQVGTRLNLERALRMGDELGGHIVSGHVDGIAELISRADLPHSACMSFRTPRELSRFIAQKGSVTLDGVSLTVNEVKDDEFSVLIIPHTLKVTTLGNWRPGEAVNLEIDQMARYAARLMQSQ
jgi:riboflavin synthase